MEVLTETMGALAEKGQEGTFVIIEDADQPDQFAQFKHHDGVVYGEVGSRQWVEPYQPLAEDAVIALGRLGFTGGGPQQNYSVDGLPVDALALARLPEELFHTGYGRRTGLDLVVSTNNEALYALLEGHGAWVGRLMSDELDRGQAGGPRRRRAPAQAAVLPGLQGPGDGLADDLLGLG